VNHTRYETPYYTDLLFTSIFSIDKIVIHARGTVHR